MEIKEKLARLPCLLPFFYSSQISAPTMRYRSVLVKEEFIECDLCRSMNEMKMKMNRWYSI